MWRWMRSLPAHASVVLITALSRRIGNRTSLLAGAFFGKGFGHLVLDPVAPDGVLGQDQQHLVAQPDRFVDGIPGLGSNRQVMRREPAAHAFALEVGMEAIGEVLVLARIADEAGEE